MPIMFDNGLFHYGASDPEAGALASLDQWAGADATWLDNLRAEWAEAGLTATPAAAPAPAAPQDIWGSAMPPVAMIELDSAYYGALDAEGWLAAFSTPPPAGDWLFG